MIARSIAMRRPMKDSTVHGYRRVAPKGARRSATIRNRPCGRFIGACGSLRRIMIDQLGGLPPPWRDSALGNRCPPKNRRPRSLDCAKSLCRSLYVGRHKYSGACSAQGQVEHPRSQFFQGRWRLGRGIFFMMPVSIVFLAAAPGDARAKNSIDQSVAIRTKVPDISAAVLAPPCTIRIAGLRVFSAMIARGGQRHKWVRRKMRK
jgi:hypothetical protein